MDSTGSVRSAMALSLCESISAIRSLLRLRLLCALAGECEDVANNFGDGLEVFCRNGFIDIHAGKKGARQRRILDDGHIVLFGKLANVKGDLINALRDTERGRRFSLLVFECDGEGSAS